MLRLQNAGLDTVDGGVRVGRASVRKSNKAPLRGVREPKRAPISGPTAITHHPMAGKSPREALRPRPRDPCIFPFPRNRVSGVSILVTPVSPVSAFRATLRSARARQLQRPGRSGSSLRSRDVRLLATISSYGCCLTARIAPTFPLSTRPSGFAPTSKRPSEPRVGCRQVGIRVHVSDRASDRSIRNVT
jgi:hypothetical protein